MISRETLWVCEQVLERYISVLTEQPNAMPPFFRTMVADAAAELQRNRMAEQLGLANALRAVPSELPESDLFSQPGTRGYRPGDDPASPA